MTVTLSRGATSVTLKHDTTVERTTGRHQSDLSRRPGNTLPTYIDKPRPGWDVFTIDDILANTGAATLKTLLFEVIAPPLGSSHLELDLSTYGLDTYQVVPVGSQAGRGSSTGGENDVRRIDNLDLRVVGVV